jgi:hypothetical protein
LISLTVEISFEEGEEGPDVGRGRLSLAGGRKWVRV